MFADSLCETSWANRSRRGWTTIASFFAEAIAVGILLILPLFYPQGIPSLRMMSSDVILTPPAGTPPEPSRPPQTRTPTSNMATDGRIIAPPTIPQTITRIEESVAPPPMDLLGSGLMVPGGTGDRGALNSVFRSIGTGANALAPPPTATVRQPVVSSIMEGNLIRRVQPVYPILARQARIQGTVILRASIGKDGAIENLQVTSGPPMLAPAAVDAVRQWRYRPYILNGQPIEVETQVTVNFTLSGG